MFKSIKTGIERKTGRSISDFSAEHFAALAASGTDAVEMSGAATNYPIIRWKDVINYAKNEGIELWSFHLPFSPFQMNDISTPDDFVRKTTIDYHKVLIDRAAGLAGIKNFVIHPSGEPNEESARAEHMKYAKESLVILSDYCAQYGARILVENLPRTCLGRSKEDVKELLSADERLRCVFDTNHLLGGRCPVEFIREIGDKIVSLHVSDYDGVDEKHWLPGEGIVDWVALMDALDGIGYAGPILYELGYGVPAHTTRPHAFNVSRDRDLTPEDFVRNHKELEAREPLTVIGKRVYDEN